MNIFNLKKRWFVFLIVLFLIGFIGQLFNHKTKFSLLNTGSFVLFSEIQGACVHFQQGISNLIKKYLFLLNLREKNKILQEQNMKLKTKNQLLREALIENKRLKKLMQFSFNQELQLLPAQVIGTDFLSKNELISINKGSQHGVQKFMGVTHPTGVVGYIFRTSPHTSQVITLLNPLSSLPSRSQNSRVSGFIVSDKKDTLQFNYLDKEFSKNNQSLKIGTPIVSLKTEQFPAGFLVGHIQFLDYSSKNLSPKIAVQPSVKFHSLEEVLIILNKPM